MNPSEVIFLAAGAAIAFVAIWLLESWAAKRLANRLVAQVLSNTTTGDGGPKLTPESDFVVDVSDDGVSCSRPDGTNESVKWDDLRKVEILTTDEGPYAPDVFWVLCGSTGGCVVPWGATGEKELMDRLQALPGFRSDAIVNAASLTTCNQLLCWDSAEADAEPRNAR